MTVSEHRFEVALPRAAWSTARRPLRGLVFRWWLALTFVALGFGMPTLPLRLLFIALGLVAYVAVGRIVDARLDAIAREIATVPRNEASRWLSGLERRRVVGLFAPHAWVALQKGRLHLRVGDGRAAAKAFEESARMLGDAEHPGLLGARAEALIEAGDAKDAQAILLGLDKRGVLTATDRVNLGLTLASESGRAKRAIDLLEQARQELGESPRLIAALALAYAKHDRLEVARELVEALDRAALNDAIALDLVKRTRKQLRPLLEETRRSRRGRAKDKKAAKRSSGPHRAAPADDSEVEARGEAEPGAPKRPASSFESSELRSEVSGTFEFDPAVHGREPPVPKYRDPAEDAACPRAEDVTAPEVIPPISGELRVPRGGTRLPDRRPPSDSEGAPLEALPSDQPEYTDVSEPATDDRIEVVAVADPIAAEPRPLPTADSNVDPRAAKADARSPEASSARLDVASRDDEASLVKVDSASRHLEAGSARIDAPSRDDEASPVKVDAGSRDDEASPVKVDARSRNDEASPVKVDSASRHLEASSAKVDAGLRHDQASAAKVDTGSAQLEAASLQEKSGSPKMDSASPLDEAAMASNDPAAAERPAALDVARQRAEAALRRARAREQESEQRRARALAAREQVSTPATRDVVATAAPATAAPATVVPVPVVVEDKPTVAPKRNEVDDGWSELFTYDDDVAPAPSGK